MIKIALPWRSAPRRAADRRAGPLWEAAERSSREIRIERSRGKSRSREIKRNREKSGSRAKARGGAGSPSLWEAIARQIKK